MDWTHYYPCNNIQRWVLGDDPGNYLPCPIDVIDDCGIPDARYDELVCIHCNLIGLLTHLSEEEEFLIT